LSFAPNTYKNMPFSLGMTSHSSAQHFLAVPSLYGPQPCLAKNIFWG
jgi:hypothetical protein